MRNEQQFSYLIYEYFLLRFRFGYYRLGDALPLVETLCREFGVAENTVKLALRRLRTEGYIDMHGGQSTRVLFEQSEQEYQGYIASYYSKRQDAYSDLSASAEFTFVPLLLEGLRRIDVEALDSMSEMAEQAEGDDLLHFYCLILQELKNPLAMNLLWETLFFWGFPFAGQKNRPAPYPVETVRDGIRSLIGGTKSKSWDSVHNILLAFQRSDFLAVSNYLSRYAPKLSKEEQIPFAWRIYRDHPQICFKLSVQLLHEIYLGTYRDRTYLPSYAAMAKQYSASISTVRRTIATLHEMGAVQPVNGTGIRICPVGEPCKPVDYSNPTIRRNLSFYVQAFDLARYTCQGVTRDFVLALSPTIKENLITRLEEELHAGHCSNSILHFMNCIINHYRLQAVRQVYGVIYSLFLWAAPLKGASGETPELERSAERFTALMLQRLGENDAEGCVVAVKELIDRQFIAAEKFLLWKGIPLEELQRSPTIRFLVAEN